MKVIVSCSPRDETKDGVTHVLFYMKEVKSWNQVSHGQEASVMRWELGWCD